MNIVYNSDHYSILAYPTHNGFELLDKSGRRSLFLQGVAASSFRHAIEEIPEDSRDEETIDAFLDEVCADSAQPIVFH